MSDRPFLTMMNPHSITSHTSCWNSRADPSTPLAFPFWKCHMLASLQDSTYIYSHIYMACTLSVCPNTYWGPNDPPFAVIAPSGFPTLPLLQSSVHPILENYTLPLSSYDLSIGDSPLASLASPESVHSPGAAHLLRFFSP